MITTLSTTPGPNGSGTYPLHRLHTAQRGLHQGDPVWDGSASCARGASTSLSPGCPGCVSVFLLGLGGSDHAGVVS